MKKDEREVSKINFFGVLKFTFLSANLRGNNWETPAGEVIAVVAELVDDFVLHTGNEIFFC